MGTFSRGGGKGAEKGSPCFELCIKEEEHWRRHLLEEVDGLGGGGA